MATLNAGGTFALEGVRLDWAAAGLPADGETQSGDRHVVLRRPAGVMVAVIDGLGHGEAAARAAEVAAASLTAAAAAALSDRVLACHESLRSTRGVVAALGDIDARCLLTYVSVGNVEGLVLRRLGSDTEVVETFASTAGILGMGRPRWRERTLQLQPGDLLLMATDGVAGRFFSYAAPDDEVAATVARVLEGHRLPRDDALVLAVRCAPPGR